MPVRLPIRVQATWHAVLLVIGIRTQATIVVSGARVSSQVRQLLLFSFLLPVPGFSYTAQQPCSTVPHSGHHAYYYDKRAWSLLWSHGP